jgi:hypothetical protein
MDVLEEEYNLATEQGRRAPTEGEGQVDIAFTFAANAMKHPPRAVERFIETLDDPEERQAFAAKYRKLYEETRTERRAEYRAKAATIKTTGYQHSASSQRFAIRKMQKTNPELTALDRNEVYLRAVEILNDKPVDKEGGLNISGGSRNLHALATKNPAMFSAVIAEAYHDVVTERNAVTYR